MSVTPSAQPGNPPAVILATDDERALIGDGVDLETLAAYDTYARKELAAVLAIGDAMAALGMVARSAGLDLWQIQSLAARLTIRLDILIGTADLGVLDTFGGEDR